MLAVLVAVAGHHLQGFVTGNPLYCRKIDTGLDEVSYGEVACQRQGEILQNLANPHKNISTDANEIAEAVFKKLSKAGVNA